MKFAYGFFPHLNKIGTDVRFSGKLSSASRLGLQFHSSPDSMREFDVLFCGASFFILFTDPTVAEL